MPTQFPYGHALAVKKMSVALFHEYRVKTFFENYLGGTGTINKPVPNPIRIVDDVKTDGGLSVTIDLLSDITGNAVYGADVLAGKEKPIAGYSQEIKLDQVRQGVDLGSRRDRKALKHDLRMFGKDSLQKYFSRWQDQYMMFMLTGVVPNQKAATTVGTTTVANANFDALNPTELLAWLTATTDFAGNTIQKPYTGTYYSSGVYTSDVYTPYTGSVLGANNVDFASTEIASLEWLEYLGYRLQNEATPPTPLTEVRGKPMWLLLLDSKAMTDLRTGMGGTKKVIDMQQYKNEIGPIADRVDFAWGNLMVCEYNRIIRAHGAVSSDDTTLSYNLILGADAGCLLRGTDPDTGNPMIWTEEKGDHGDKPKIGGGLVGGFNVTMFNSIRKGCRIAPTYFGAATAVA